MLTIKNLMFTLIFVLGLTFALDAQVPPQQNPQNPTTQPRQEMQNQTPSKVTDYIGKHFAHLHVENAKRGESDAYDVEETGVPQLTFETKNENTSIRSTSELS